MKKRLVTYAIAFWGALYMAGAFAAAVEPFDQQASPRTLAPSTDGKLNVMAFGAHPDDCDQRAGGTAATWAALGHRVRFVAVTNGDAGHQTEGGGALAARRRAEAQEAGRRIGIEYVVLDNHDGELVPSVGASGGDHAARRRVAARRSEDPLRRRQPAGHQHDPAGRADGRHERVADARVSQGLRSRL